MHTTQQVTHEHTPSEGMHALQVQPNWQELQLGNSASAKAWVSGMTNTWQQQVIQGPAVQVMGNVVGRGGGWEKRRGA